MKQIAVYSGSFDPIHAGHAIVAQYVSQFLGCQVWLMPSRCNPLKQDKPPASDADRYQMCALVANEAPFVEVSDFEFSLPVPSYTYVTLCALKQAYPDCRFRQIIGSDNWRIFDRWRDYDKIIRDFGLIIYPRPGYELTDSEVAAMPENVVYLKDAPKVEMSSTFIREKLKKGCNMNFFIPCKVYSYIKERKLYTPDE